MGDFPANENIRFNSLHFLSKAINYPCIFFDTTEVNLTITLEKELHGLKNLKLTDLTRVQNRKVFVFADTWSFYKETEKQQLCDQYHLDLKRLLPISFLQVPACQSVSVT